MTTLNPAILNPTQLVLEINQETIDQAWKQSQSAGNDSSKWQKYLNQVALATLLSWLQAEEAATAKAGVEAATQAEIWEVV